MLKKSTLIIIFISLLFTQTLVAFTNQKHSIVLQPNISLDSFMPDDMFGVSLQYEYTYSNRSAFLFRALGFKNPALYKDHFSAKGFAISTEYRLYLSKQPAGFHIGPTMEWIRFQRENPGSGQRDVYDMGVILGYRKDINIVTTDISLKMGWYSPTGYPKEGMFPKENSSPFNTTMLVSIGFKLF